MNDCSWTVYVDDNFHFMDEDERYSLEVFENYDAAVAACKKIVDRFLQNTAAKSADELYDLFSSAGEDPWIKGPVPDTGAQQFSAFDYARQRCNELRP